MTDDTVEACAARAANEIRTSGWHQGDFENGGTCLYLAISHSTPNWKAYQRLLRAVERRIPLRYRLWGSVISYNDAPRTTVTDVLGILDGLAEKRTIRP